MTGIIEITFKEHPDLFREGIAVAESYRAMLAGFRFIRYRTIHFEVVDAKNCTAFSIQESGSSRCKVTCPLDMEQYTTLPPEERKIQLYAIVFDGMAQLAAMKHWDAGTFINLHAHIRSLNYIVPVPYYPSGPSPSRARNAVISVLYTFDYAEVVLKVYDINAGLIQTLSVYKCDVATPFFSRFFTFKEWVGEDLFVIKDTHREIHFVCDLLTEEVVIELHPGVNTEAELRQLLQDLHYNGKA